MMLKILNKETCVILCWIKTYSENFILFVKINISAVN